MRGRAGLAVRVVGGLIGAGYLVVAFLDAWDRSQGLPLPSAGALAAAFALVALGLAGALGAWAALLPGAGIGRLASGFLTAQLGKYVPGAVWQAVGQVDAAYRLGVPLPRATTAFVVSALTQAVGGGVLGAALAFAPVPPSVRLGAAAGLLLVLLLDRRWMAWLLARLRRGDVSALPEGRRIRRAWLLGLLPHLTGGLAFALLLAGTGAGFVPAAIPAAILAWTVGFLALPFPSGIGVREAVLVAALGGWAAPTQILAASLALRLVTIAAEAALIAAARVQAASSARSSSGVVTGRSQAKSRHT